MPRKPGLAADGKARGIALLIVLAVLALLSVLALTFVSLSRLERQISMNYVDSVRALLTAESGVERAVVGLQALQGGVLGADEFDAMAYNFDRTDASTFQWLTVGCKTIHACSHASYGMYALPSKQEWSGWVSSTHSDQGDKYRLKIVDTSACINLNDTNGQFNYDDDIRPDDPADMTDEQYTAPYRLQQLVVNLADGLFHNHPLAILVGAKLYFDPVTGRNTYPGDQFPDLAAVTRALDAAGLDPDQQQRLLACVTLYSWQDPDVIRPTTKFRLTYCKNQGTADYWNAMKYSIKSDVQCRGFEPEPRAPVNVNGAAMEVLQALLWNVDGYYHTSIPNLTTMKFGMSGGREVLKCYGACDIAGSINPLIDGAWRLKQGYYDVLFYFPHIDPNTNQQLGGYLGDIKTSTALDRTKAEQLAVALWERIHGVDADGNGSPATGTTPNPMETWEEFRVFLTEQSGILGFDRYTVDALLANFNPNSRLNDYTPTPSFYQEVDKSELRTYTTEFCFGPTGVFDVTSLGVVMDTGNQVLAKRSIHSILRVYYLLRQTTQQQFLAGWSPATPGAVYDYFSLSNAINFTNHAELSPGAGALTGRPGVTMDSYPEPLRMTGENFIDGMDGKSRYDGYLQLATLQTNDPTAGFMACFDGRLKPTRWGQNTLTSLDNDDFIPVTSDIGYATHTFDWMNSLDNYYRFVDNSPPNHPTAARLTQEVDGWDRAPGILYPDGAYCEPGRVLGYRMANFGAANGSIASIHFWVKPQFSVEQTTRPHAFFQMTKQDPGWRDQFHCTFLPYGKVAEELEAPVTYFYGAPFLPTHTLVFGMHLKATFNYYARVATTVNHKYPGHGAFHSAAYPEFNLETRSWNHIALAWSEAQPLGQEYHRMTFLLNGESITPSRGGYHAANSNTPDNHWDPQGEPNYFRLGGVADWAFLNHTADAVFDEVVGLNTFANDMDPRVRDPWRDGRYYADADANGYNGVYTSPRLYPYRALQVDGRRRHLELTNVAWTAYLPRYNRCGASSAIARNSFTISSPTLNPTDHADPMAYNPADPGNASGLVWGGAWDPITIDFATGETAGTPDFVHGGNRSTMPSYAGGVNVRPGNGLRHQLTTDQPFRYRLYMNINVGQTLYESPLFDDVTFTFLLSSPLILHWLVEA